jgi:hypothetical protein
MPVVALQLVVVVVVTWQRVGHGGGTASVGPGVVFVAMVVVGCLFMDVLACSRRRWVLRWVVRW